MKVKSIAMYLPQFHEVEENNRAWGKGFTEWTNVRKAKPLYQGHNQPRIPLDDNYYDLTDISAMRWQAKLANEAGIYGFCFYHYWFMGRMVLERPVQMLLDHKEINMNFCFAWANESWTRTWHGAGGEREILIAQRYGDEDEWAGHYGHFRRFFLDERYVKLDDRPVVLVYRVRNIPEFNPMFRLWNRLARKDGFPGVYIISMNTGTDYVSNSEWVNGTMDFEPNRTKADILRSGGNGGMMTIDYDEINLRSLARTHAKGEYRTVFADYDDTPRRGGRGVVTEGVSPKKFGRYLRETVARAEDEDNSIIFINAWNEWGEGNYLEPDERNGYAYLDEIRDVFKGEV